MSLAPIAAVASTSPAASAARASPSGRSFGAVMEARSSRAAPPLERGAPVPLANAASIGLQRIERAQVRLDALLATAKSGRTFTAQELMALQGEAYRFSQTVELSAKLVEQGAQAVKQALHAQV